MRLWIVIAIAVLALIRVEAAGASKPEQLDPEEAAIYSEVFRVVIDQRLGEVPDDVFFLSLSLVNSAQPEGQGHRFHDAPPVILEQLAKEGLPVFPGSDGKHSFRTNEVTHRSTGRIGTRVVLGRVSWEGDSGAIVYYDAHANRKDGSTGTYRLAKDNGYWSVVSVDYKRKS